MVSVETSEAFAAGRLGPITGVQLHSIRAEAQADLAGALRALAGFGYRRTEITGYLGRTPQQIRAMHDAAGLSCVSAHVRLEPGTREEPGLRGDLSRLAEHMHVLGARHVVVPAFPVPDDVAVRREEGEALGDFFARVSSALTEDHWRRRADELNTVGGRLAAYGLRIGFHNHAFEFDLIERRSGVDLLLAETDPDCVVFQLDAGWASYAGFDPATLLRVHPKRFRLLHLKDIKPLTDNPEPRSTEVGCGTLDWRDILAAADEAGVEEAFVEQEPPFERPPLEAMAISAANLRALGW
ncbi:sugar phosphate isomerase/epimerase [Phenylobacterium sp. LjRoot225]|uniref:sugar phosphate isomerase/epimerase family protein n=1 Tax=Phenylobacterium sp. LjRoot225 TaxID=3342285 RepID=UPI003ECFF6FF